MLLNVQPQQTRGDQQAKRYDDLGGIRLRERLARGSPIASGHFSAGKGKWGALGSQVRVPILVDDRQGT